jgi:hypothetical protein
MKGKRRTIEQKFSVSRKIDGGKSIVKVCKEYNIPEITGTTSVHRSEEDPRLNIIIIRNPI